MHIRWIYAYRRKLPMNFQWDEHNEAKLASHSVDPEEAVDVFYNDHIELPAYAVNGETRNDIFGRTNEGRVLLVAYTLRGELIRVVNSFTPSRVEIQALKRRYPDAK